MSALRTGQLEVEIAGARAVLRGRLDDTCQLGELASRLPAGDVVLDTAGVTFVNSIGLREWARLLRTLRGRGTVVLDAVSDVLITQMNLISEFHGVTITSFHAAYVCPACGCESAPRIDAALHADALRALQAPAMPCPECGAATDLADYPERYLSIFRA